MTQKQQFSAGTGKAKNTKKCFSKKKKVRPQKFGLDPKFDIRENLEALTKSKDKTTDHAKFEVAPSG